MKSFVLLLSIFTTGISLMATHPGGPGGRVDLLFGNDLNADPVTGRKYSLVLKVNTLQVLFSEAPVSVEFFGKNNTSHQLQAGIIFPLEEDSFLREFFQTSGIDGTANETGIFSYRLSPYNNHGVSFRYEFRKYYERFYAGPQIMYKHVMYDGASFNVYNEGLIIIRKESKSSSVLGIAFLAGRQTYFMRQATDWYAGIGIRGRKMNIDIHHPEPGSTESATRFSVYPFVNFGFRTGLIIM